MDQITQLFQIPHVLINALSSVADPVFVTYFVVRC